MKHLRSISGKVALMALCAATASTARAIAATSTLPVYPGATKLPRQPVQSISSCGHTIGLVAYNAAANAATVAIWYKRKIPGAIVVDMSRTDAQTIDTEIEAFTPDGSQGAVIHQLTMTSAKMQASSKSIGADKTGIGLETFDPPLGADLLSLENRARRGDPAAKHALIARCGKPTDASAQ